MNKTNGNIWTVIVFHSILNLANRIMVWERINTNLIIIEIAVFGVICVAVLLKDKKRCYIRVKYDINTSLLVLI